MTNKKKKLVTILAKQACNIARVGSDMLGYFSRNLNQLIIEYKVVSTLLGIIIPLLCMHGHAKIVGARTMCQWQSKKQTSSFCPNLTFSCLDAVVF